MVYVIWLPALYILLNHTHKQLLIPVTTHLRWGKMVRILSQLRESDLPVGDASRTLPSSSGLLEVLPIYRLLVDYIGSKVCSVSWGSLAFPSAMRTERCAQAVAYLSCCQYIDLVRLYWELRNLWIRLWVAYAKRWSYGGNCMAAASIVSGNVWERFHECWHERFIGYIYMSVNLMQVH